MNYVYVINYVGKRKVPHKHTNGDRPLEKLTKNYANCCRRSHKGICSSLVPQIVKNKNE